MNVGPTADTSAAAVSAPRALDRDDPVEREVGRLDELTGEFEAIFVRQLLKEAKLLGKAGGGGAAGHVFETLGIDSFAHTLVGGGGVGLREVLFARLEPHVRATAESQAGAGEAHDEGIGAPR